MTKKTAELGRLGEDLACKFLERSGYLILERNYRNRIGEADIIALDGEDLVVVEVKTRQTALFGRPEEQLSDHKRRKMVRVALGYMIEKGIVTMNCRFDIVAISVHGGVAGPQVQIELIRNGLI